MIIRRQITEKLISLAQGFPVVALIGPRQSGKTTLAKETFKDYKYFSMEDPDTKLRVLEDPRGFFALHQQAPGMIIDEIQETPELLSYMQGIVDAQYKPGFFIITGSQNFLLLDKVSQTLAGRIALLTLLPLTLKELRSSGLQFDYFDQILYKGFYPRPYVQPIDFREWFSGYIATYVQRDVRTLLNVTDLKAFQNFLKLCAGRIGQLLNFSALADDCDISPNTAKAWISILEASYIVHLLQPYYKNFSKRIIKSPKLYFYDTGLACSLLSIYDREQFQTHYLRGALFENFVINELMKYRLNQGKEPSLYFWRDVQGHEIDCIVEQALALIPIEIKSGMTVKTDFFDGLKNWNEISGQHDIAGYVVYGGNENQPRKFGNVIGWDKIQNIVDQLD